MDWQHHTVFQDIKLYSAAKLVKDQTGQSICSLARTLIVRLYTHAIRLHARLHVTAHVDSFGHSDQLYTDEINLVFFGLVREMILWLLCRQSSAYKF